MKLSSEKKLSENPDVKNFKYAIIVSKFNETITYNLLEGAKKALEDSGANKDSIKIFYVPGAFEIPVVLKKICRQNLDKKIFNGVITIGCVIKGETAHFEYICETVSDSINKISYEYEMPVGFCVLTCFTPEQAIERSKIPPDENNNKGYEAGNAVIEMINLMSKI